MVSLSKNSEEKEKKKYKGNYKVTVYKVTSLQITIKYSLRLLFLFWCLIACWRIYILRDPEIWYKNR